MDARTESKPNGAACGGDGLSGVGGVLVDGPALLSLSHRCDPLRCRQSGSCCAEYDVWIGDEERRRLLDLLPRAAERATHLRFETGLCEPFRRLGPDAYALRKDAQSLCLLAYRGPEGQVLCSPHSAALDAGLPPERAKPESCVLWPLCLTSSRPPVLSVHEKAFRFPCNRRREGEPPSLDEGVAEVVRAAFGADFLGALTAVLRARTA